MTHIIPKQREDIPELEPMLKMVEASMGFLPTSMMTMAHWPLINTSSHRHKGNALCIGRMAM